MADPNQLLERWREAGLIDADLEGRIRAFETAHAAPPGWRWPIRLALAFGALMLGAGVLLFVSAHWDAYSPAARFGVVLAMAALFHVAAAASAPRTPALASTLHAVGTVACGAGIFLAGQIFNLDAHWPSGVMLWAGAAAIAWNLLRAWPQLALTALLVPAWLVSEWTVATQFSADGQGVRIAVSGIFLLAAAYFSAVMPGRSNTVRRVLMWIGGILILPAALALAAVPAAMQYSGSLRPPLPPAIVATGWTVAIGLPAAVAVVLRRTQAWPNLAATAWVVVLVAMRSQDVVLPLYAWWALGAASLAAWGVRERRPERINMGAAVFAGTVLAFYFSEVMSKLGRSASLVGLGILFLAGGWGLEQARRRFVRQATGDRA